MQFTINGKPTSVDADPRTSLLDLLRDHLHLFGAKKGCNQGACGACTVLVDGGQRILSCLALAAQYDGREITTIEGLADEHGLHPLQDAFADDARVLLVFGGSQGAASLNRAVAAAAADLAAASVAVLHAHGAKNTIDLRTPEPGDPPYVAVPYLSRMDLAYAAADLAICRSGAMTVAEVTAVGLPAVYVPLPIGNGEQRLNALPVVNAGGGILVADADLTPDFVADQVAGLLNDAPRLAAMTTAAALVGHPDAARQVARVALEVARAGRTRR